jgi:hypothetical protein
MFYNIFTVLADMPASVKGFAVENDDDSYTVVLNSKLSYEQNTSSFHHELSHIINGDFDDQTTTADEIEHNAHK